jgi:hypothetical protein
MTLPSGSWPMSTTFAGFTLSQAEGQLVTLSETDPTVVDIQVVVSGPGAGPYAPTQFVISGGFQVTDPDTGDVSDIGALVSSSTTLPGELTGWWVHLIFPPQVDTPTVAVNAWAYSAVFAGA